ncbi:HutD-family protein [Streptomyces tateyamensis]|uniref:HutD-family protein n=1 Tax=Streptomyces tateyamensis TaxID=565073 RepID=A0A2V4NIW1_9ACTN|nr:HutD family protein [Streptomyces tateyamensis]PYC82152.1 HutD-family protein [Streptomyces tateyamensis]
MPVTFLPAAVRRATPWRNGGGLTREVALTDFSRVSLAEIEADGPFSVFPDCHRIFTVVAGAGVELTVGQAAPVRIGPLEPFAFPGAAATGARLLDGPVTVLNLITRHAGAEVALHPGPELRPAPGHPQLAVDLDGYDALLVSAPDTAPLPPGRQVVVTL